MDIKDVFKFYNKTGDVVSTAFFCIFSYAIADLEKYDNISLSDVAVFANNITISFVQMILDNPEFFEKRLNIKKRKRLEAKKDLADLRILEYSDSENTMFFESWHDNYIKSLQTPIYQHNKQYYEEDDNID